MLNRENKIKIYGGLGNQMFQYALYLYLNQNNNKSNILITDYFLNDHHSGLDIAKAFKLKLNLKNRFSIIINENLRWLYKNKIAQYFLKRAIPKLQQMRFKIYREKNEFKIDYEILVQRNSLFVGTWQSTLYLKNIRESILEAFVFKNINDENTKELAKLIQNQNSVSLHIRRGDYLRSNWEKTHFVIKDLGYYFKAIEIIESKVENPFYYVFSDDISWVKENLKIDNAFYVSNNIGSRSYIDMYLMSLCKHNIIANSTFSWWGAWLNRNNDKIVITPSIWVNGCDCSELIPQEWSSVEV